MTKPTKRARKKDSTMLNNQARIKDVAIINHKLKLMDELISELQNQYEGLSEWVADIDATVMPGTRKK